MKNEIMYDGITGIREDIVLQAVAVEGTGPEVLL